MSNWHGVDSLVWELFEATWETSASNIVLNRKYAKVFFPNGWGLSFVTGNDIGMYADEETYQISVLNPDGEIAYHFGNFVIGNTTYYSDDVWGYVPNKHVDLLATWVSEFPGNLEHKLISNNSENYDYDDDFFAGLNDVSV